MHSNTGEARERMSLWTRKSRVGGPMARKIMSASGKSNLRLYPSLLDIVAVVGCEKRG